MDADDQHGVTCNDDEDCETKGKQFCDYDLTCYGFSYLSGTPTQELKKCTTDDNIDEPHGNWRTMMKISNNLFFYYENKPELTQYTNKNKKLLGD